MAQENRPLLRSSTETFHSSHRRHVSRSMSLRAALLAFPLPRDTPSRPLARRHTTSLHRPSPLSSYNSNYVRLATERRSRIQARKSYAPTIPEYALPSNYTEIQRIFPVHETDSSSMIVEIDIPGETPQDFTVFEDPIPRYRAQKMRKGVLIEGEIASRQKLRRKIRRKAPREISANIMRSTGSVIGKTVSETVEKAKDAFEIVRESTGHLGKIVKKWKQKMENSENIDRTYWMDRSNRRGYMKDTLRGYNREREDVLREYPRTGDELHKYLYDLHGGGIEVQSSTTDENRPPSVGYVVPVDDGWSRRKQTWTNLSSVLMDGESVPGQHAYDEESVVGQCGSEERGLPVIEEVVEISQCGLTPRKRDFPRTSVRDVLWEGTDENEGQKGTVKVGKGTLKKVEEYLHGMTISPPTDAPVVPLTPSDDPVAISASHTPGPAKSQPLPSTHQPIPPTALPAHTPAATFTPTAPFPNEQNWDTFSASSLPASLEHKSRLPFSETTQDLFNVNSTTYYTVPTSNDLEPVKTTPLPPMEAEITRSESLLNHYMTADTGTITFPNQSGDPYLPAKKKEIIAEKGPEKLIEKDCKQLVSDNPFRVVSGESHKISSSSYSDILGGQDFPRQPRHLSSSTSSLSADQDPSFQRQVSSIYSRPQNSRQVSQTLPPLHGRSASDTTGLLGADTNRLLSRVDNDECILIPEKSVECAGEKSVPAIEAFKWLPPRGAPAKGTAVIGTPGTVVGETSAANGTVGEVTGKSVRDRVKELDLAIDSAGAMKFDGSTSGVGLRRKRSFFGIGRWRGQL